VPLGCGKWKRRKVLPYIGRANKNAHAHKKLVIIILSSSFEVDTLGIVSNQSFQNDTFGTCGLYLSISKIVVLEFPSSLERCEMFISYV